MPNWLLILICIVCWGSWAVLEKQAVRYISPQMIQVVSAYVYSMIAPFSFLYMKITNQEVNWDIRGILWTSLACILGTIATLSFATAVNKTDVHYVVGFTSMYPLFTFLLCYLFLNESITSIKLFGLLFITIGMSLFAR